VLKPVVVTTTEPAELVMVPTRGMVVTADWAAEAADEATDASEAVTEAAADPAAPVALARAEVKMGRAAGVPETLEAAAAHWPAANATA
jgi:hypothetical protein